MKKSHIIGGAVVALLVLGSIGVVNGSLGQGRISRFIDANTRPSLERESFDTSTSRRSFFDFFNFSSNSRPVLLGEGEKGSGPSLSACTKFGGEWETILESTYEIPTPYTWSQETAKLNHVTAKDIQDIEKDLLNNKYKKYCYTQEYPLPYTKEPKTDIAAARLCDDFITAGWSVIQDNSPSVELSCIFKDKLPEGPKLKSTDTYIEEIVSIASHRYFNNNIQQPGISKYRAHKFFISGVKKDLPTGANFFQNPSEASKNSYLNRTVKVTIAAQLNDLSPAAPKPDCYLNPNPVQPRNYKGSTYDPCKEETPKPYTGPKALKDHPDLVTRGELADLIVKELAKDGINTTSTDTCAKDTKGHKYGKSMCYLFNLEDYISNPIEKWSDDLRPDHFIQRDHATRFITESFKKLQYPEKYIAKYDFYTSPYYDVQYPSHIKAVVELWTKADWKMNFYYQRILALYYGNAVPKNNGWFYPENFLTKKDAAEWVKKAGAL